MTPTGETGGRPLVGRELGHYRILSLLGVGGMGEVYRARDQRLGREVAIKVLPADFASSPERRSRFEREARVLASLNHPHIATLHGIEERDAITALVLELVEGPTLAERLTGGPVPVSEAIALARQITEALEAAHDKGIVHRDLKPANIKVTGAGTVKVLDFGLAKADVSGSRDDLSRWPTLAVENTREGVVLGTAGYMSPEQARGLTVDRRTDLWAFGCVLYEMLSGRRAFSGATVSDTIASVLEREPDWTRLPASTPPAIRRLLRRCLEKTPARRLRDAGDARLELDEALAPEVESEPQARPGPRSSWTTSGAWLAAIAVAGAAGWILSRVGAEPLPVTRTTVTLPSSQELDSEGGAAPLSISPDGRRLVYAARSGGGTRLYRRDLDEFEARALEGADNAGYPFFSPDGQWVGFFADGKIQRVSIDGGAPISVCDAPRSGRGAAWGPDGTIVFDDDEAGLMRVPSGGGRPEPVPIRKAVFDPALLEWPHFLPGGRAILVTSRALEPEYREAALAVISLDGGELRVLGPGSQGQYAAGYVVFHAPHVREGELHAAAFDADRLTFTSAPTSIVDGVFRARAAGGAYFAAAQNGTLVFAPGGLAHTLVRVDRNGRRTPLSDDRLGFRFPRISPDGSRVAVTIDPRPSEIWVYDTKRHSRVRVSTGGHNLLSVWRPDGRAIDFTHSTPSESQNRGDVYSVRADGSAAPEPFLSREHAQYPADWSRDGEVFVFNNASLVNRPDVWILPASGEPRPLVATAAVERAGRLSVDGRWIAYSSDESGRFEVYVRPFPDVERGKWIVSTMGGHTPVWSPDGRELFYMNGSTLMAVPFSTRSTEFVPGTPEALFDGPFDTTQDSNYDVAPDGSFVMVEADPDARPKRIQAVLHFAEELNRASR